MIFSLNSAGTLSPIEDSPCVIMEVIFVPSVSN